MTLGWSASLLTQWTMCTKSELPAWPVSPKSNFLTRLLFNFLKMFSHSPDSHCYYYYVCECLPAYLYVHHIKLKEARREGRYPGIGVSGSCKSPSAGAGD